jgi:hypothetical protein
MSAEQYGIRHPLAALDQGLPCIQCLARLELQVAKDLSRDRSNPGAAIDDQARSHRGAPFRPWCALVRITVAAARPAGWLLASVNSDMRRSLSWFG